MKAADRRQKIIDILSQTQVPISASVLAGQLGVSRQIIVGDVALLTPVYRENCVSTWSRAY